MAGPPRPGLRVLVKGASTVHTVSWMGGDRGDFAYPRATERALYAVGVPAEVRCTAMSSQRTRTGVANYPGEVAGWAPDVVVLNYGHFETIHLFLPQRLERHVHSMAGRPGRFRTLYRTGLRKSWRLLARLQQQVDQRVPATIFAHRPRRVADQLVRLVELTQAGGDTLVLVLELTPPGASFRKWFPGMAERMEVMNAALAEAVRGVDRPHVRFFPTGDVLAPLVAEGHDVNPDGGHYTPEAHRAIGEALAAEIVAWGAEQGRIATAEAPTREQESRALPD